MPRDIDGESTKTSDRGSFPHLCLDKWGISHHSGRMKTLAETILEDVEAFMLTHGVAPAIISVAG